MAWLALALERAGRLAGVERPKALKKLSEQFLNAWVPEDGGGIPWRKQDQFFNAPANGPAGIFLARYGDRLRRAQQMSDWIDETLIDPETHLVFDGIKAGSLVRAQYTYCQGVVIGLEVELAARTEGRRPRDRGCTGWSRRSATTWRPTASSTGAGGGDGGLFNGILARYLALVATTLPQNEPGGCRRPATSAKSLVLKSGAGGVGQPSDRRRSAAVRGVLGPHGGDTDGAAGKDGRVRRGRGQRLRDTRARSVGAAVGLDADGGRCHRGRRVTAEPLPRIVRLLPDRFSRDPKAPSTKENTAAGLLLAFTSRRSCGPIRHGRTAIRRYWTPTSALAFGDHRFELTVKHLINDGLMTFFFFIVGLEVTQRVRHRRAHRPGTGRSARRRRDRRA